MTETKTIEITEDVFTTLRKTKGNNTWSEHLNKLYQAAHGDVMKLDEPTLSDFTSRREGPLIGSVEATDSGELELLFERSDGTPIGMAQLSDIPEGETIEISLEEGSVVPE